MTVDKAVDRFGYQGFLVDLDGTLIGRDQRISPRVARAVGEVKRKIPVAIATGREPSHVIRFAKELGLNAPQVCDNGALALDPNTEKVIWSAPLTPERARRIVTTLQGLGLAFIATHVGGTLTDADEITSWNLTRVSALDMEETPADALVAKFESDAELHVVKASLPYNGMWAVDFTCNGINKASAARRLAKIFGTDASRLIAAGDSHNDLLLLEACGLGIAMGNAPNEVKAIADYVAPSVDEDGLAVAIEEFVLPRL